MISVRREDPKEVLAMGVRVEGMARILEELKSKNLSYEDDFFFTKDYVLIHRGLLHAFTRYRLFYKFVGKLKKGGKVFELKSLADKDYKEFLEVLYALRELEVLDFELDGGTLHVEVLKREFFGKKTLRRSLKTLFAGITAYRTMRKLGKPFEVVFNVKRNEKTLYDVAVLTDQKCLFFCSKRPPEVKLNLSVPYQVYSLISPANIGKFKHLPYALNVLRVRELIGKEFGS
ncbi:MAG: hypothetical protein NZ531_00585 [Aquificaceae bacterium]|nr:hypothetical protein [Aquificaceae bacterium]